MEKLIVQMAQENSGWGYDKMRGLKSPPQLTPCRSASRFEGGDYSAASSGTALAQRIYCREYLFSRSKRMRAQP